MQISSSYEKLFTEGEEALKAAGIEESEVDAWYLMMFVFGIDRTAWLMERKQQKTFLGEQVMRYRECISRRAKRIPLQYITGVQYFMGYAFKVNEAVLIPRHDTEILVEAVLTRESGGGDILDMCTGSGCIAISLALEQEKFRVVGADISQAALVVASENAKTLDAAVGFVQSDLFGHISGQFDVIVSNPPYIPPAVIATLSPEVSRHEPMNALDGGADGLDFYRRICEGAKAHLVPGGRIYFEIGYDQADMVSQILEDNGYKEIECKQDLAGLDRVVMAIQKHGGKDV